MRLSLIAANGSAGAAGFIFGIALWVGVILWVMRFRRERASRKLSKSFEQSQAPTFTGSRPISLGQRSAEQVDEP